MCSAALIWSLSGLSSGFPPRSDFVSLPLYLKGENSFCMVYEDLFFSLRPSATSGPSALFRVNSVAPAWDLGSGIIAKILVNYGAILGWQKQWFSP